jgi:hypothetical protein
MSEHHPNQMDPYNVAKRFMNLSRQNQTPQNLAGDRGSVVTAQERKESTLRQQQLYQQQQQQQQQLLEQQQQQQQQLIQQQQQQQQQQQLEKEQAIAGRVQHALNPTVVSPGWLPTTQDDPRATAWNARSAFMEMSRAAQTPRALSERGPTNKGGGRYNTKKKSKKSKQSKRKSNKHKMQKKKTRRNRRLVK